MRTVAQEIETTLGAEGVIARRQHPELATALAWLARTKRVTALLPGIYASPEAATTMPVRLKALSLWAPDAVLTGATAGRLAYWPDMASPTVTCAMRRRREPQAGFVFTRRVVPPELVVETDGVKVTNGALTTLDLCDTLGADVIDMALRTGVATLQQLHDAMALIPGRDGNVQRRLLLLDSRDGPWSVAERLAHRLLRQAGIRGWAANYSLTIGDRAMFLDIAFPHLKLAIEIDGRLHETKVDLFEDDRRRQNLLVLHGWRVLRFTWAMLTNDPEAVIEDILTALSTPC